eukprot:TRINITY_DN3006_c0_g1_i4.p2 TRINITY_DN3006_c0_g1~~TRINITY_DN3006_c0_g1_i4.p2  ORF type:complete len:165 (+),score=25.03 TRINITY_DN3006_c0_g1_i4:450-944(+)
MGLLAQPSVFQRPQPTKVADEGVGPVQEDVHLHPSRELACCDTSRSVAEVTAEEAATVTRNRARAGHWAGGAGCRAVGADGAAEFYAYAYKQRVLRRKEVVKVVGALEALHKVGKPIIGEQVRPRGAGVSYAPKWGVKTSNLAESTQWAILKSPANSRRAGGVH